ncbi:hypothetical protein Q8F55_001880 [Vanrija albida]|uniref:ABM domain-containing protein n=1 Tax=Vanrija albida TaxID=181172 RepID=A0ABR3Q8I3_9TREE
MAFAPHLTPPYYAVIFTSTRRADDTSDTYGATADRMVALASQQPGFLGVESARGADGLGITVSYWRTLDDIAAWKAVGEHLTAQRRGREAWYDHYAVRIAKVERAYDMGRRGGKL